MISDLEITTTMHAIAHLSLPALINKTFVSKVGQLSPFFGAQVTGTWGGRYYNFRDLADLRNILR